jgi:hypothetical protein
MQSAAGFFANRSRLFSVHAKKALGNDRYKRYDKKRLMRSVGPLPADLPRPTIRTTRLTRPAPTCRRLGFARHVDDYFRSIAP